MNKIYIVHIMRGDNSEDKNCIAIKGMESKRFNNVSQAKDYVQKRFNIYVNGLIKRGDSILDVDIELDDTFVRCETHYTNGETEAILYSTDEVTITRV